MRIYIYLILNEKDSIIIKLFQRKRQFERKVAKVKNVIVLFGKPGAGKGTLLSKFLKGREERFEVLSVGNLLRRARKEQTELGKKAGVYMDAGQLVPNEIINEIVIQGIKAAQKPVITDGFPRTVLQAQAMLDAGVYPDRVIEVYVDDEVVIQRAKDRIVCERCGEPYTANDFNPPKVEGICDKCGSKLSKRKDDEESVVKKRLQVYQEETHPVLQILKDENVKIFTIDNSCGGANQEFEKAFET